MLQARNSGTDSRSPSGSLSPSRLSLSCLPSLYTQTQGADWLIMKNHIINYSLLQACLPTLVLVKGKLPSRAELTPSHLTSPLIEDNSEITEQFGKGAISVVEDQWMEIGWFAW